MNRTWVTISRLGIEVAMLPVSIREWMDADMTHPAALAHLPLHMPVVLVTIDEAKEYAQRDGSRLLTDHALQCVLDRHLVLQVAPANWEWSSTPTREGCGGYRGGGWSHGPLLTRTSRRVCSRPPGYRYKDLGFRVCRDLPKENDR